MLTGDTKMQERGYRRAIRRTSADAWRLTAAFAAFILTACQFLLPPAYYRLPNVLLLLPGAWVGSQQDSFHPPQRAGGFAVYPLCNPKRSPENWGRPISES